MTYSITTTTYSGHVGNAVVAKQQTHGSVNGAGLCNVHPTGETLGGTFSFA